MANLFEDILNMIGGKGGGEVQAPVVSLPTILDYKPENYRSVGQLAPSMERALTLGPSAMEGVSTDPATRAAQMSALTKLMGISEAGGKDAQFMSDYAKLQNDINANLKGNQGAIQQNLATRGLSGGMSELVARQQAAQSAANRQSQAGLDINAQAQQRALQALMSGANLGGQMQQQDFNQQAQIAQAKDLINQFNTRNTQSVLGANVDRTNMAQQSNLQNAQNITNMGVEERNKAQQINRMTPQQMYENRMEQAGLQTEADAANQARKEQRRSGNLGFAGGLASAAGQIWGKS